MDLQDIAFIAFTGGAAVWALTGHHWGTVTCGVGGAVLCVLRLIAVV